jgi:hypothetical protein
MVVVSRERSSIAPARGTVALMAAALRMIVFVGITAALAGGCKRSKKGSAAVAHPDTRPDVRADTAVAACPDTTAIAKILGEPAALLRSGCFGFPYGTYWMAGVVHHDRKTGAPPRVQLVAGGSGPGATVFDVKGPATETVAALAKRSDDLEVTLKAGRRSLVRFGIAGRRGGTSEEIAIVLQLVAHSPPKLVWVGAGDQVTAAANGCVSETRVSFDTLFGSRLEIYVNHRARRADDKPGPPCPAAGLGSQETVQMNGVALEAGRRVGG